MSRSNPHGLLWESNGLEPYLYMKLVFPPLSEACATYYTIFPIRKWHIPFRHGTLPTFTDAMTSMADVLALCVHGI